MSTTPQPQPPFPLTISIPAIPPLPVELPLWLKRVLVVLSVLNALGLGGVFAYFRDNPDQLVFALQILKWPFAGSVAVGGLVVLGVFVNKMYNAKLANDLNIARLNNRADRESADVDFNGWKKAPVNQGEAA